MTDTNPNDARLRAQTGRSIRLARVRSIRRRIIGGALALFVASWLLITIMLVSGHDPALARRSSGTVVSTPSTTTTATTTSSGTSSTSGGSSGSSSSGGSNSSSGSTGSNGTVSSVTTSQS